MTNNRRWQTMAYQQQGRKQTAPKTDELVDHTDT